jgi:threonine/homoserine/homoserine lactone efflux protein
MTFLGLSQTSHLWLFLVMVLGVVIMPGMDMVYVMSSTLVGGRKSGMAAVAGITLGGMLHVLMGVLGVGILLKTYPAAFNLMLLLGSLYIAWIGWSIFRGAAALAEVQAGAKLALPKTFNRAFVTCLLNPKAYVFMLAIFPQFLRPSYGPIVTQAFVLGGIIALCQIAIYGAVAMSASAIQTGLRQSPGGQVRLGQGIGVLLIGAAVLTFWQGLKSA